MKEEILIVFGITILFLGTCITPTVAIDNSKKATLPLSDGNTLYVGGTGPCNYSLIQDAVDNATDGDTVFVYAYSSPYYENLVVNKSINLVGENPDTTIIDGSGIYGFDVVTISADWVNISRFTIENSGNNWSDAGIFINSNYNAIINNNILNNGHGIWFESSNSNTIINNKIKDNQYGLSLRNSCNNSLSENLFLNIGDQLRISNSDDTIINNNIIQSYFYHRYGIDFYHCNRNYVSDNSFYKCGISFQYSTFSNMSSNTVNEKPLIYIIGESNITIKNAGQIIILNCYNITVENLELSNVTKGIIGEDIDNCFISNNIFKNNICGISLRYSSSFNIIKSNVISYSVEAMRIIEGYYNIIVGNNIFQSGEIGLGHCDNISIISNNITENDGVSIYLKSTTNSNISDNIIYNNTRGIFLDYNSDDNIISNNEIKNNVFYGMQILRSSNNNIFHNNFIYNSQNAYDEGKNNWDDGYSSGGNYWDDYTGEDTDGDGIGDTPYPIPGGDNQDRYPLMIKWGNKPPDIPSINFSGKQGRIYCFIVNTKDPDGDNVCYFMDWGDGTTNVTDYYPQNVPIEICRKFWPGTYNIRVKGRDIYGAESNWSDPLVIEIPRTKASSYLWYGWLIELFPLLEKLLSLLS